MMMKARLCTLPVLAASLIGLICSAGFPAFGQSYTAAITGTVTDANGGTLPGTAITVKHLDTGLTRTAESDANGRYSIPSLPVGAYEVTAVKPGFNREVRRGVDLVVGQEAVLQMTLQLGSVEQQITVTDAAPLVNTTLNSTAGLI